MKRPSKKSAGFTLVELLVVMAIMSLVLAAVIATKPKTAAGRVAIAARAVASTLQLARAQAMSGNAETVVLIDIQKLEFGSRRAMQAFPRGMQVAMTVADTERAGDIGRMRFYPDGQSSGGEIALTLEGQMRRVSVNWLTGEPQVRR